MSTDNRLRVLYVEDDSDAFEMLKVMLGLSQIDVDRAPSIGEALAKAASEGFDLYLIDSGFPDGDGINLCRTLRALDPDVPVLIYSGNAHTAEIERGMTAGAAAYITKPNSDKLAETILRLVGEYRHAVPQLAAAA